MPSSPQDPANPEKKKKSPSATRSVLAGATAGAIEIGMSHLFPPKLLEGF